MRWVFLAIMCAAVAACAGREAQPIATVQPQDATSDCAMVQAEIQANNKRAEALASEENGRLAQNVAAGVVGVVVWPVLFAMDTKGAAKVEAGQLQGRQQYLTELAAIRCAPPPPPQSPPSAAAAAPKKPKAKPLPVAAVKSAPPSQASTPQQ